MKQGRVTADLTPTQLSQKDFGDVKALISKITVQKLLLYSVASHPVSHTTIYNYLRGVPISEDKEDGIILAIEAYQKAKQQRGEERLQRVRKLVENGTSN